MKQSIVYIEWEDSSSLSGWRGRSFAKNHTISKCKSVGFLFSKDNKKVVISQSKADTCDVGELMAIPMSAVKKIKEMLNE